MLIDRNMEGSGLTLALSGRLDAGSAPLLEEQVKQLPGEVSELVLDFMELDYISSAGLRVLLMAQKRMNRQGELRIINASRDIVDVFDMTGMASILSVQQKLREVSVEGCEFIGGGMCGECWKLDEETVLKLYFEDIDGAMVEREKAYARAAFVLGIPTAISYDVVACGPRRGVVFEMFNAQNLATVMAHDREHLEHYAAMMAQLAKLVHRTVGDASVLPSCDEKYRALVPQMEWMTPAERAAVHTCLDRLAAANTCVHGDFHPGNIMLQDGQLMFIDMGDFAIGHPLHDITHIYDLCLRDYSNDLGGKIIKLGREDRRRFWHAFARAYYGELTPEQMAELTRDLRRVDCVRQMFYIRHFAATAEENKAYMRAVLREEGGAAGS